MSMRNRLTSIFTVIIAVFVMISGIFASNLIEKIYINILTERLIEETKMLNTIFEDKLQGNEVTRLDALSKEIGKTLATRITIVDNKGVVLADSEYSKNLMENHANRPEIIDALNEEVGQEIRYSSTLGINMLYVATAIRDDKERLGVIRLAIPLKEITTSLNKLWLNLIIGLLIVFFLTILIIYRVADKITSPLENITRIARKISESDFSERLQIDRKDEIGQLGLAVNMMADSLGKQIATINENEEKLTSVLKNMSSGVILVDKQGKIILTNPAVEDLIGEKEENILGKHHNEIGKQDSISELIDQALKLGTSIHEEIGTYFPTKKYINGHVEPIFDLKYEVSGALAVLHDITKVKHLEKMRTEFIANVSHELRTPITAVKGFAETLLEGQIKEEETINSFLKIIYKESDRLHRLITDLLDLSKIELNKDILKYRKVDIKGLIESTVEMLRPQLLKHSLQINIDLYSARVEVDEDRLKQVIINLLSNAIAYTPENGTIIIRVKDFTKDKFKIEVEDSGIGIPSKSLPRVFERFYRVDKARSRESGGTGLGLAIAKHIIESHSGNIFVESEIGKGTRFTIILPKRNNGTSNK